MYRDESQQLFDRYKILYPQKFAPEEAAFSRIHPGARIYIGGGCGQPQYLVKALNNFAESYPGAFNDAEIYHGWNLEISSAPLDVVLVQVSMPNQDGYFSLGVSVNMTKSVIENAGLVVAQVNKEMPFVFGDGLVHIDEIDFLIPFDEPILEWENQVSDVIAEKIGEHVARIINDGNTIQIGYGNIPNAIISKLKDKSHLGVHTEVLTDGIVELMKAGVIDNSKKSLDPELTIATCCMGKKATFEYLHHNPNIQFRSSHYTNSPQIISQQNHMIAINCALEIDLTGQGTTESLGKHFYSGTGGQTDFMRGAVLSKGGTSILVLPSTADQDQVSRIVPFISKDAGETLTRGDIHYVVTEYGIAYLHGKNIREIALDLIAIAHPKFRPWLLEKAQELGLVYPEEGYFSGDNNGYPESLATYRTTETGIKLLLRPVKISDEPLFRELFYSLSEESKDKRFITFHKEMPYERLKGFLVIDYLKEMEILAVVEYQGQEELVGIGQYSIYDSNGLADVALIVKDNYQNKGVGQVLLSYLIHLANTQGLRGFRADVLVDNVPMLHLFEKMGFDILNQCSSGICELRLLFRAS